MRILVHVIPGSRKRTIESGTPWKIHLCARPVEGKANQELIDVLSNYFSVPHSSVRIVSGFMSRNKVIEIGLENKPTDGKE